MKASVLYSIPLLFTISAKSWGAKIELPLGGKFPLDEKVWSVRKAQDIVPGKSRSLILINKNHTDLMGYSFDGTIQHQGACGDVSKKTASEWSYCKRELLTGNKVSHQITIQRKLGDKIFQNYVFAFNVSKEKNSEYGKVLKEMVTYLEKNK